MILDTCRPPVGRFGDYYSIRDNTRDNTRGNTRDNTRGNTQAAAMKISAKVSPGDFRTRPKGVYNFCTINDLSATEGSGNRRPWRVLESSHDEKTKRVLAILHYL